MFNKALNKKVLIIVALLLILTAVFAFCHYFFNQKDDKPWETIAQVHADGVYGSGIILKIDKNSGKLLLCANTHLLEKSDSLRVILPDESEWMGTVVKDVENTDLGYFEVDLGDAKIEGIHAAKVSKGIESGMAATLIGSTDGPGKNRVQGVVEETDFFYEPLDNTFLFVNASAVHGMSGGGLFDEKGCLVGMISGGNEQTEEVLCVPVEMIIDGMDGIVFGMEEY